MSEIDTISQIVVLVRLFIAKGQSKLAVSALTPLSGKVTRIQLSRLEPPVQIVSEGKEETAERPLFSEGGRPLSELLLQGEDLIGKVRPGGKEPFIYREDLFPKGFEIKRNS